MDTQLNEQLTFDSLGLSSDLLTAITNKGFIHPTPIQALTIPVLLKGGCNLIAQAQTGTGKTAAFGLPLIELIDPSSTQIQAIVLSPTRELALQITREIHSLNGNKNLKVLPVYGGQSISIQLRELKKGVHIVVGTPGRILDHLNRKSLSLSDIGYLILDEADEMLNMGFIEDMERIMSESNPDKETLLFSATMPPKIRKLAEKYMGGYQFLKAEHTGQSLSLNEHIYYELKSLRKFEGLCKIIEMAPSFYGMVFCRTKRDVDSVVSHLLERGFNAEAIHGDISQVQREKTLSKFRNKKINILVATDVAARGIDVNDLTHVINYSLPQDPENYVHRAGRTGRAGKKGVVASLVTSNELRKLKSISKTASSEVTQYTLPTRQDILETKKIKIYDSLVEQMAGHIDPVYYNMAKHLLTQSQPTDIIAAILNTIFNKEMGLSEYAEVTEIPNEKKERSSKSKSFSSSKGRARQGFSNRKVTRKKTGKDSYSSDPYEKLPATRRSNQGNKATKPVTEKGKRFSTTSSTSDNVSSYNKKSEKTTKKKFGQERNTKKSFSKKY